MPRWERGCVSWTPEQIDIVRDMRASGACNKDIADAVGKSYGATNNFIQRYADRYNIVTKRRGVKGFESSYNGSVPYLHWSITKPWRVS